MTLRQIFFVVLFSVMAGAAEKLFFLYLIVGEIY